MVLATRECRLGWCRSCCIRFYKSRACGLARLTPRGTTLSLAARSWAITAATTLTLGRLLPATSRSWLSLPRRGLVRRIAMGGELRGDLLEGILAVTRLRRRLAMACGAAIGDTLGAAIEHQSGIGIAGCGQHRHRGIENLLAVAIQGDDVGAAEALADHKGVAGINHVDIGDGEIAHIDGGNRRFETHGPNF